jgi:hypothetical protein
MLMLDSWAPEMEPAELAGHFDQHQTMDWAHPTARRPGRR